MNSKRLKVGGLSALIGTAVVTGALAFGSGTLAQTPTPGPSTKQNFGHKAGNEQNNHMRGAGGPEMRGGPHGALFTNVLTKTLGIDATTLQTELKAGKTIADLATAKGVNVNSVIDAIVAAETANAKQRATDFVNGKFPAPFTGGPGMRGHFGPNMSVIEPLLGMNAAALRAELQAGKSIADVATAKGVDVNKIIDAVVADHKTRLDKEVAAGRITQAQADQFLADAKTRVTAMVNSKAPQDTPPGNPGRRGPAPKQG